MSETNSKATIMQVATGLFSARGYDAVSVSDIVNAAGVTKPTLYYFYGSKEGLFTALLRENYKGLDRALGEVRYAPHPDEYERDVWPVLLQIVRVYFLFAAERTEFYLMVMALTFAPRSSKAAELAEEHHRRQYELVHDVFCEIAKVHKGFRGREWSSAWRFIAMINAQIGFWQRGFAALGQKDAEAIVKEFLHGVFS